MILFLALILAVLGVAMIGFAIVALRDEPPRWMLRVKRPGWIGFLGAVTIVVAFIVNSSRQSVADDVAEFLGRSDVDCERAGVIVLTGEREDVYACVATSGSNLGCFARVQGDLLDVTRQALAISALKNRC